METTETSKEIRRSQTALILEHLKAGKTINPIEALNMFNCFRLSGRIADLRRQGYNIVTDYETAKGKHWANYRLKKGV